MKAERSAGTLTVDGEPMAFADGDTLAACLIRAGRFAMRRSRAGEQRGVFCGIGICNDCLVAVDGVPNVRACVTDARDGLAVQTGIGAA